jgi:prepilin-type N-terminal cleavage/methylation domain-containing protein
MMLAMRMRSRQRRAARSRRGFTLGELLVTMTLIAIIGTLVAKIMLGQSRFYHREAEQVAVRRELRTAMSLVPSDLRGVSSSGGDLLAFDASSVTFRNVLGASIVCAKPTSTTMDLPPLNMARNVLTSWYTPPQVGDSVFAFNEGMLRGAEDDTWTGMRITAVQQDVSYCPASPYMDAALDAGKSRWRLTVTPAIPDSVKIGAGVRFVRSTRYTLAQAPSTRWYLNRAEYTGGAWGPATPVSGPYDAPGATSGVRFRYFDSTGVEVTNVANAKSVARIDLLLRSTGARTSGDLGTGTTVKDSLAFRIALRNRQ